MNKIEYMELPQPTFSFREILTGILSIFAPPAFLFVAAGDWLWLEGGIWGGWYLGMMLFLHLWLYFRNPHLLKERFAVIGAEGQGKWDIFWILFFLAFTAAWVVLIAVDVKRMAWSPDFHVVLKVVGVVTLLFCFFLIYRAFADNSYLAPSVRMQHDRGHTLVSTGVYGLVRHPMYLGGSLLYFGTPLLLSSLTGLVAGLLIWGIFGFRIVREEKMLVEELEGYAAYREKVRYRLMPFIW